MIKLFKLRKFPSTILRLYQAYGPRQELNRFIPIIINSCIKNKKFPCSDGNQFRDFVFIDDVIEAIIKSLKNKKAKGEIFNIGSGKPIKIKNIIKYLICIEKNIPMQLLSLHLHVDNKVEIEKIIRYSLLNNMNCFDVSSLEEGGCSVTIKNPKKNLSYDLFIQCILSTEK